MSLRYTAMDSMDAAALSDAARESDRESDRNVERWREKIEVRLDNRQVFFLFFGSAVVACMLFVLGVMVGKRIESRGQAEAAPMADPLAALQRPRYVFVPHPADPDHPQLVDDEMDYGETVISIPYIRERWGDRFELVDLSLLTTDMYQVVATLRRR